MPWKTLSHSGLLPCAPASKHNFRHPVVQPARKESEEVGVKALQLEFVAEAFVWNSVEGARNV